MLLLPAAPGACSELGGGRPPSSRVRAGRDALAVILSIRCFGGAARRADSNEPSAPTEQSDRLAPAAGRGAAPADFFLAIESGDAGAGAGDHGDGGSCNVMSYRVVAAIGPCCAQRLGLAVILSIRCFGGAARRAASNEPSAPTEQSDRLAPVLRSRRSCGTPTNL
jgi:hypothetical protein